MKHDENLPTDPELEARIVAWVLGEASAFEVAELERRIAAEPSLAVFKRRIEAVHGLVREANRPPTTQRRLSPERRSKLLATIGVAPEEEPERSATAPVVETMYPLMGKQQRWKLPLWAYSAAACLLVGLFVAYEVFPVHHYSLVKGPRRTNPSATILEPERAPSVMVTEGVVDTGVPALRSEMASTVEAERRNKERVEVEANKQAADYADSRGNTVAHEPTLLDQVLRKSNDSFGGVKLADAPAVVLSQPAASPQAKTWYYGGGGTGASARKDGLLDAAQPELAKGKTEVSLAINGLPGQTSQTLGADFNADSTTFGVAARSVGGALTQNGEKKASQSAAQGPTGGRVARADSQSNNVDSSVRDVDDVIVLSPFAVTADKDQGFMAANAGTSTRLAGSRVNNRLADLGSSLNTTLKEQFGGKTADVHESDKPASLDAAPPAVAEPVAPDADIPVAHPPPAIDETLRAEAPTKKEAVSTFSLHVSDVSFRLAQAALNRGEKPDAGSIRPEEFYNAFDYGDPAPVKGEAVACRIEQSAHPFLPQRNLVRIAMKVPASGRGANQPLRLTVLLDTSGSMEREDRVASVRRAFASLATLLGPADRVTLIGFARQPRLLADAVSGERAASLNDIIARTPAEGGTNLEAALKLAGEKARAQYDAAAQNRIVLLTDGAANLGSADPAQLAKQIAALRQQGLAFDACGIGIEGLDDSILEALTRQGDGRYYVINSPDEADASFARKLAGAFRPAAENVKVQVRFNPSRVESYRLIGFEQHRLRTEDFRNDKVDAAELAAEEDAVALYQIEIRPEGEGELGDVFVRFRTPGSGAMVERSWTLPYNPQAPSFDRASPSLQLAGTAAFVAEKLRGGGLAAQIQLSDFAPVVNRLRGSYANDARVQEFVTMFGQARRVVGE